MNADSAQTTIFSRSVWGKNGDFFGHCISVFFFPVNLFFILAVQFLRRLRCFTIALTRCVLNDWALRRITWLLGGGSMNLRRALSIIMSCLQGHHEVPGTFSRILHSWAGEFGFQATST